MNCPKCNAKIAEGSLYCINCGEPIQIVPDYNPVVEESLQKALGKISIDKESANHNGTKTSDQIQTIRKNIILIGSVVGCILILLLFAVLIYKNSYFYLKNKAYEAIQQKEYDDAIYFLEKSVARFPNNEEMSMALGSVYCKVNDYDQAVKLYSSVIKSDSANIDAYKRIISIYEKQNKEEELRELLSQIKDKKVKEYFSAYLVDNPEFSVPEGSYTIEKSLKLSTTNDSEIYYTLDGTNPTTQSQLYIAPIMLDDGITVVTAISVNKKGIKSEPISYTYRIAGEEQTLENVSFTISPDSGTYESAQNIKIDIPNDYSIYYTTDGSDPNPDSKQYNGLLPMPMGESTMKFAIFHETELIGDIQTREYNLSVIANYPVVPAIDKLKYDLVSIGYLADLNGNVYDATFQYTYDCTGAFVYKDRIYYMIEEYVLTSSNKMPTNKRFAFDVLSGDTSYAAYDSSGNFVLNSVIQ